MAPLLSGPPRRERRDADHAPLAVGDLGRVNADVAPGLELDAREVPLIVMTRRGG